MRTKTQIENWHKTARGATDSKELTEIALDAVAESKLWSRRAAMMRAPFHVDPGVDAQMRIAAVLRCGKATAEHLVELAQLAAHTQCAALADVVLDEMQARVTRQAVGALACEQIQKHVAAIATESESVLPLLMELVALDPRKHANGNGKR